MVLSLFVRWVQGAPNSVQTGAGGGLSTPEQSWIQGYNQLIDSAAARPAADPRFGFGNLSQLHAQAQVSPSPPRLLCAAPQQGKYLYIRGHCLYFKTCTAA